MTSVNTSSLSAPTNVHDYLATVEAARRRQLDALPNHGLDPVTAAHRTAVEQIVDEVRAARQRLALGLYGICAGCEQPIAPERLELRPWATRCTPCSTA
ncbi:MAG TPA: TraR/DksA C4-type zinc finger protein [Nocardioidaceae bacterium]|nr:TraR/DksA C4-type zinc finger protein [Nocardioidaceae bacterium]